MNKQDWLFKLRKVTEKSTLEKIIERKEQSLTQGELIVFYSAADHRLAEITVGRLFDKVPAHIWRYIQ
ncbi:hemolysin expression modulator Hha [Cronobacter turicensis]|nr:hemolysin expression modulator Hha [Cronobacter sakazakii]ELY4007672.1 hemolysin expression modulator Hha [Cronobacter dublinensis]ELY4410081.1 hemolysin expression modulator Hha [Cronobacter dublinensis]ELY4487622.1 hemolysin expression modulator Hha [Cronobacter dublinensis]